MKTYLYGGKADRYGKSASLLLALSEIMPERATRDTNGKVVMFDLLFTADDTRGKLIVDLYVTSGLWDKARLSMPDFGMKRVAYFEPEDWAKSNYFWLRHCGESGKIQDGYNTVAPGADGNTRSPLSFLQGLSTSNIYSGSVDFTEILVSGLRKREFEQQGFIGLGFRPVVPVLDPKPTRPSPGIGGTWKEWEEFSKSCIILPAQYESEEASWWELFPTLELPPQHSSVIQYTLDAARTKRDVRIQGPGVLGNEGTFDYHPVYTRSAIESVVAFDVARSYEYVFGTEGIHARVHLNICSRRFMDYFKKLAPDSQWLPIEVRDE